MPEYTTVTSPIRRYADLVVQRQLKHALTTGNGLYGEDELRQLITRLGVTQGKITLVQRKWTRYWILKYLEQEDIQTLNALVLTQTADSPICSSLTIFSKPTRLFRKKTRCDRAKW